MRKFQVESANNYDFEFDNHYGDYIYAETPEEAVESYKTWLQENGEDPEKYVYQVRELFANGERSNVIRV